MIRKLINASQSLNDKEMVLQEQAWLFLVGKGYIFFPVWNTINILYYDFAI